jgi:hypothetical protein
VPDTLFGIWTTVLAKSSLQPSSQEKNHDSPFWEFNFAGSQNVSDQEIKKARKDPCFGVSICEGSKIALKGFLVVQRLINL